MNTKNIVADKAVDRKNVVFLDRDGVINRDRGNYVRRWEEFEFLPGVDAALRALAALPVDTYIVSNQAAVGKDLMTAAQLQALTERMLEKIAAAGGSVARVLYCQHAPQADCACRKPKPGLLLTILSEYPVPPAVKIMIGDTQRDITAGHAAGCYSILTLTGKTATADAVREWSIQPDFIAVDLSAAVQQVAALIV